MHSASYMVHGLCCTVVANVIPIKCALRHFSSITVTPKFHIDFSLVSLYIYSLHQSILIVYVELYKIPEAV